MIIQDGPHKLTIRTISKTKHCEKILQIQICFDWIISLNVSNDALLPQYIFQPDLGKSMMCT